MMNNGQFPDMSDIIDDDAAVTQVVPIDLEDLDSASSETAKSMIQNLNDLYGDEEILKKFPQTKARLDVELETLRGLIKMRKADEAVHDTILSAISTTPNNASLYRSLADIQRTSLQITEKIDTSMKSINTIIKSFQTEMDHATGRFEVGTPESSIEDTGNGDTEEGKINDKGIYRGAKSFIQAMQSQDSKMILEKASDVEK